MRGLRRRRLGSPPATIKADKPLRKGLKNHNGVMIVKLFHTSEGVQITILRIFVLLVK